MKNERMTGVADKRLGALGRTEAPDRNKSQDSPNDESSNLTVP